MRPEERERLFREAMDAYVAGDLNRVLDLHHPDIEVTAPDWMNAGTFHGHEGFREWSQAWYEAWEAWTYDLKEVRSVGERHVVARVLVKGRGRGSSVEVEREVGYVVEVEDGVATYLEVTADEESALAVAHEREVSN